MIRNNSSAGLFRHASPRVQCALATAVLLCALFITATAQTITFRGQSRPLPNTANALQYSDLQGEGNTVVIGTYGNDLAGLKQGALIFDISNPANPVLASQYNPSVPSPTTSAKQQMLEALIKNGTCYFGSGNGGGVHIVNCSNPYSPTLITRITGTNGGGFDSVHEILLYGNFLIENRNDFSQGALLRVINISNPAVPVFVRQFTTTDGTWVHATHIAGNRLFTSGWGGKTDVYDLSNIANAAPTLLGTINTGTNSHSSWTSEDGNYLYNCRELQDGDLRVYDIHNLAAPTLVKTIKAGDLGINAICPHNPVVVGNLLFVAWYQAGVQVFDIRNPANPVRVAQYDTYSDAYADPDTSNRKPFEAKDPWDILCGQLGPGNEKLLPTDYGGDWSVFPFLGLDKVVLGDLKYGLFVVDASHVIAPRANPIADFDGDLKTDISQYRPSNGAWYVERSSDGINTTTPFGISTDVLAPADYDGDGKTDPAVYRDGAWYQLRSTTGFAAVSFGLAGDIPVPGDYDSDGKADVAVFRPSTGSWYIIGSATGFRSQQWGIGTDKPVPADYDGDGRVDIAVFRGSTGAWYILPSTNNVVQVFWGTAGDRPVPGDFDGDSKADVAVYRPSTGTWYINRSQTGTIDARQFGNDTDTPVPADFDGDGKADLAVYRPSVNTWFILRSTNGSFVFDLFGQAGDKPAPAAFVQ
ncbi:MAG: FG-GAP-like repeat-containing protein [Pyrinomonadaceae bacterium]